MSQQLLFVEEARPDYPAPGGRSYSHWTVYLGVVSWNWRNWCKARRGSG